MSGCSTELQVVVCLFFVCLFCFFEEALKMGMTAVNGFKFLGFILNVCCFLFSPWTGECSTSWRVCHSLGHAHKCVPKPGPRENKGCARVLVKQAAHAPRRKSRASSLSPQRLADLHVRLEEEQSGLLNPRVTRGWRAELRRRRKEKKRVEKSECLQLVLSAVETSLPSHSSPWSPSYVCHF